MSQSKEIKGLTSECELGPRPKRPYHKPAVRYERVFETQALTCGKTGSESQCHRTPKTS